MHLYTHVTIWTCMWPFGNQNVNLVCVYFVIRMVFLHLRFFSCINIVRSALASQPFCGNDASHTHTKVCCPLEMSQSETGWRTEVQSGFGLIGMMMLLMKHTPADERLLRKDISEIVGMLTCTYISTYMLRCRVNDGLNCKLHRVICVPLVFRWTAVVLCWLWS